MSKSNDKTPLELLAPAGNADIGIAAIDHGADAVYIGAPRFSARANAGVPVNEIERLIRHAHLYYARVYVALNTILAEQEFPEALDVVRGVYQMGADGVILQDVGLLEMDLPPIPLIASTQMHNETPAKILFLEKVGFKRVILARELSLSEIAEIRRATRIELEYFVHGALCVSYSGQCYMSQAVAGRSGNRGVCAQPCRSRYTLIDGDGNAVVSDRFLLSLRDLNLMHDIPDLVVAGITSFKIEGRYKDISYVKNVTAAYSRSLDAFIHDHPAFCRSSSGRSVSAFLPDPAKSFNRGFTRYFMSGRVEKIASMVTPKSIGQPVGSVTDLGRGFFRADCADLQNGDGLCFFAQNGKLEGFRVERVDNGKIFPNTLKGIAKGILLYRNHNTAMVRLLQKASGQRRIRIEMDVAFEGDGVCLRVFDEDGNRAEGVCTLPYAVPKDPAAAKDLVKKHLSSTGSTSFRVDAMSIRGQIGFVPISVLNRLRRTVLDQLLKTRSENYHREIRPMVPNSAPYPEKKLDYHANVLNKFARQFYARHGAEVTEQAFEALPEVTGREVMRTRYCLRGELDACLKSKDAGRRFKAPLRIMDGHHAYLLKFDCEACRMSLIFLGKK